MQDISYLVSYDSLYCFKRCLPNYVRHKARLPAKEFLHHFLKCRHFASFFCYALTKKCQRFEQYSLLDLYAGNFYSKSLESSDRFLVYLGYDLPRSFLMLNQLMNEALNLIIWDYI